MTTLRIALRDYSDFENALAKQARLVEAAEPARSTTTDEASAAILETAQHQARLQNIQFP